MGSYAYLAVPESLLHPLVCVVWGSDAVLGVVSDLLARIHDAVAPQLDSSYKITPARRFRTPHDSQAYNFRASRSIEAAKRALMDTRSGVLGGAYLTYVVPVEANEVG